jgi:Zn-dependent M28 family amino/carboxypeptidase
MPNEVELRVFTACFTPEILSADVDRYSGVAADGENAPLVSRHIFHPDNARAVEMAMDDLERAGGPGQTIRAERVSFTHEGQKIQNVVATLPATEPPPGDGIVIISAHLDSTAMLDPWYRPCIDRAPGADDDASGIAAVLAATRAFAELSSRGIPHREVRFALFNSEEVGIVGSAEYAAACAALGEKILGVFHMDMIGHDGTPPPDFEVHAGHVPPWPSNGGVLQACSRRLADVIDRLRPAVSPCLPTPQIFDTQKDPGVGLSDHSRFHESGYAACVVSEDFFPGGGLPGDQNPNYHRSTDVAVDAAFAASVGRLVAAAAWSMATC